MAAVLPAGAGSLLASSSGSFLIKPGVGLMIWTLLVFGITMVLLGRLAFPRISAALDRRQKAIEESIDTARQTREEADRILAEGHEREGRENARQLAAEAAQRAQRDIEAATQRALQELRRELADLTVMATEKVTRKALSDEDQKRLVQEALGELDFAGLSGSPRQN